MCQALGKTCTQFSSWLPPALAPKPPAVSLQVDSSPPVCPLDVLGVSRTQAAEPGQGTVLASKRGDTPVRERWGYCPGALFQMCPSSHILHPVAQAAHLQKDTAIPRFPGPCCPRLTRTLPSRAPPQLHSACVPGRLLRAKLWNDSSEHQQWFPGASRGRRTHRPWSKEPACWRTEGRRAAGPCHESVQGWTFQGPYPRALLHLSPGPRAVVRGI